MLNKDLGDFKKIGSSINEDFKKETFKYIVASFGLIVGLAWNDAVKGLIEYLYPFSYNNIFAKFMYAGLITIIAIVLTKFILNKDNEK